MSDLISKQAVIDAIQKLNIPEDMCVFEIISHIEVAIATLPSVENKGEWIKIKSGDKDFPESIVCSKCKNENSHLDFNEHGEPIGKVFVTSKFCPNCGADMRGE